MTTYDELKNGNLSIIIIGIILSGMGLYIALVLADTIKITIDSIVPKNENPVATAWISLAISFVIIIILVVVLIQIAKIT